MLNIDLYKKNTLSLISKILTKCPQLKCLAINDLNPNRTEQKICFDGWIDEKMVGLNSLISTKCSSQIIRKYHPILGETSSHRAAYLNKSVKFERLLTKYGFEVAMMEGGNRIGNFDDVFQLILTKIGLKLQRIDPARRLSSLWSSGGPQSDHREERDHHFTGDLSIPETQPYRLLRPDLPTYMSTEEVFRQGVEIVCGIHPKQIARRQKQDEVDDDDW